MPFAGLKQTAHLRLVRVSDPDEFKAIGFLEIERQVLLAPYFYGRAITALPGVLLMLEQTSPRNLSAMMHANGCSVIVPMNNRAHAIFNARSWQSPGVGMLRGQIAFDLREEASNTFAVIRFCSDMQNRGWDETEGKLRLHNAGREDLLRLQQVILSAFVLSATSMPHLQFLNAADKLRHELVDALDNLLTLDNARRSEHRGIANHRRIVSRLDEFAHAHPELPLYSEALANELGTSVRTLQAAVNAIHGASLHQHLRNRRLWSLRAQLAKGLPMTSVSSAAMANGFLHMGELSRLYKLTFGELPSETLARSKG